MLKLKNIINNLPCAVMVANSDRRIILANRMTPIIFGEDDNNLIGKRGGDIMGCVHATESPSGCGRSEACKLCAAKCAVNRAFREKTDIEPFETLIETHLQGHLYLKFTVTYLKNPLTMLNNEVASAVIVAIDNMTEYKKRERLEAVIETVGALCHEMNQPLMVLIGQLDLLEMDVGENPRFETFREQVERMSIITRKLHSIKGYATKPYLNDSLRILDLEKPCA